MAVLRPFLAFFFANYINTFHKTEVHRVILRCWTGLNLHWFKSYDTNEKHEKRAKNTTQIRAFLQNCKNPKMEIFSFCVITFEPIKIQTRSAPQNGCLNLSFVKYIYVIGKKLTKNGCKMAICQSQILMISLY